MTIKDESSQVARGWVSPLLLFGVITALTVIGSIMIYRDQGQQLGDAAQRNIEAIANLKAHEVAGWRADRLADAEFFHHDNPAFARLARRVHDDPDDAQASRDLSDWLVGLQTNPAYEGVYLLDSEGALTDFASGQVGLDETHLAEVTEASASSDEPVFLDIHLDEGNGLIHLSLVVPLLDRAAPDPHVGTLVLFIDPDTYLYPYLRKWPIPSNSGETLLVRREGDDALVLNDLRLVEDAALRLRVPVSGDTAAAKTVRGETGAVEGPDYRDITVLAYVTAVPDSPWFVISKVDVSEAYARQRDRLLAVVFGACTFIFGGAGLSTTMWRQQQRTRYYRAQLEAEQALADSEERFRAVYEQSGQGITMVKPDGTVVLYNDAMERLSGYSFAEVKEHGWFDLVYPDESLRTNALTLAEEAIEGGVPYVEVPIVRKDGQERWISFATAPAHVAGELHNLSILTDVTDRVTAERQVRDSEELLQIAGELASLGGWSIDLAANRVHWSDEVAAIHETPPGFSPTIEEGIDFYAPESKERITEVFTACAEDGTPYDEELQIITATGRRVWVRTVGVPIADKTGAIVGVRGAFQDITERKMVEQKLADANEELDSANEELQCMNEQLESSNEQLQALNEELESTNEELHESCVQNEEAVVELERLNRELEEASGAKSHFLASMSHELRTPLNSVIGFSGILLGGLAGPLNTEQQSQITMINTSGQHLLALINDVLDLAKVEAGKVTVALEEFDVADVADEVVTALGPDSSAKGLAVNFARPDTAVNVFSDCGKVRQILLNLAGNAVKFTEAGHIDVTVSVRDDGAASISVADTGPGISPEDMSRIFEAFQQIETPDAAKPQGTGLGLALCREHARLLGAEISAESVVGKGSTFTLVLPVTQNA